MPYHGLIVSKIGRFRRPPDVRPLLLKTPHLRNVCGIIPDLLNIAGIFNYIPLRVPEIDKLVMAGSMSTRPIDHCIAVFCQMISLACKIREIWHLKREMMKHSYVTLRKCNSMMIRVAAHPHEPVLHPIRNAESQHLAIEIGAAFAITN